MPALFQQLSTAAAPSARQRQRVVHKMGYRSSSPVLARLRQHDEGTVHGLTERRGLYTWWLEGHTHHAMRRRRQPQWILEKITTAAMRVAQRTSVSSLRGGRSSSRNGRSSSSSRSWKLGRLSMQGIQSPRSKGARASRTLPNLMPRRPARFEETQWHRRHEA